jgi:hypothetical protein
VSLRPLSSSSGVLPESEGGVSRRHKRRCVRRASGQAKAAWSSSRLAATDSVLTARRDSYRAAAPSARWPSRLVSVCRCAWFMSSRAPIQPFSLQHAHRSPPPPSLILHCQFHPTCRPSMCCQFPLPSCFRALQCARLHVALWQLAVPV